MDGVRLEGGRSSRRRGLCAARCPNVRPASAADMMTLSLRVLPEAPVAAPRREGEAVPNKPAARPRDQLAASTKGAGWGIMRGASGHQVDDARSMPQRLALGFAAGSFSLYWATRGVVKSFHHLRRRQLREMMLQTLPVLEDLGVQHWVDFGSLLGLIRNGDLILHDNDVDVVVLDPDWPRLQEQLTARLGHKYKVGAVRPSEDPSVMWLRVYCPLGMMDIYGAHDRGTSDVEIEIGRERLLDLPKAMVLPTRHIVFRGVKLSVPGSTKQVLRTRYGDTWMIPRYMDKGSDTIEQQKLYVRLLRMVSWLGIRI